MRLRLSTSSLLAGTAVLFITSAGHRPGAPKPQDVAPPFRAAPCAADVPPPSSAALHVAPLSQSGTATRLAGLKAGPTSDAAARVRLVESYGKLPLSFEANQGQTDPQVKFVSRGRGYTLFLTGDEAVLALRRASQELRVESRKWKLETGKWKLETGKSKFENRNSPAFNLASQISNHQSLLPRTTDHGPRTALGSPLIANLPSLLPTSDSLLPTPDFLLPIPDRPAPSVLRLKLVGANAKAKVTGLEELPGKSNYFLGNDPKRWRTNVPSYARVQYKDVYPGIDLVYYGRQGQLEYDWVVSPGVDQRAIRFELVGEGSALPRAAGGRPYQIDPNGDLVIQTDAGEIRFRKPVIYQVQSTVDSRQSMGTRKGSLTAHGVGNSPFTIHNSQFVDGRYVLAGNNRIGFEVGTYDKTKPLIIDPVLSYSTYLGGSNSDGGVGIAVDSAGNAYVTGRTNSTNFPTANPLQASYAGGDYDAFVTKLNPAGSALVYSTYLGGSGWDVGGGIGVDLAGNAYVTGETWSGDFPTANPFQASYASGTCGGSGIPVYPCRDAFVTKLNAAGSALVYSTYLGGSLDDWGSGIAVDSAGNAYVTGGTISTDFPTANPLQVSYAIDADAFVTKLNAAGSALVYSTYLGGSDVDWGKGIAVDAAGNAYVTGETYSTDFPTANPFQPASGAYWDGFVTKLNAAGSALVYSTYLGGSSGDFGAGIAVDSTGGAYVTGRTMSADFPTANPLQAANAGGSSDTFVTKLNAAGSALVYSTYLGGSGYYGDLGNAIAVDSAGNAYVTGGTYSTNFPTANPLQASYGGNGDAFVTKLNAAGSALVYSTYLGGNGGEGGSGIAVDLAGNAYVTGATGSTNFPTANPIQGGVAGYGDAFVARVGPADAPAAGVSPGSLKFGNQFVRATSAAQTVTLHDYGSASLTITGISTTGDFVETNNCDGSVAAGGASCTISVTFTPWGTGTRTGAVSITDNAAGSPHTVALTGTGVAPLASLSTTILSFGSQVVVTTSAPRLVTLTNSGNAPLVISSITTTRDYAQTNTCGASLAARAKCRISVTFTPSVAGQRGGTLTIADNVARSPQVVKLLGYGINSH